MSGVLRTSMSIQWAPLSRATWAVTGMTTFGLVTPLARASSRYEYRAVIRLSEPPLVTTPTPVPCSRSDVMAMISPSNLVALGYMSRCSTLACEIEVEDLAQEVVVVVVAAVETARHGALVAARVLGVRHAGDLGEDPGAVDRLGRAPGDRSGSSGRRGTDRRSPGREGCRSRGTSSCSSKDPDLGDVRRSKRREARSGSGTPFQFTLSQPYDDPMRKEARESFVRPVTPGALHLGAGARSPSGAAGARGATRSRAPDRQG